MRSALFIELRLCFLLSYLKSFRQNALMAQAPSVKWTREHLLIALNLYCKLPFGKFHRLNPVIIEVAGKMDGRQTASR